MNFRKILYSATASAFLLMALFHCTKTLPLVSQPGENAQVEVVVSVSSELAPQPVPSTAVGGAKTDAAPIEVGESRGDLDSLGSDE